MAFGNKIQDICYPRAWTTYQIDSNDAISKEEKEFLLPAIFSRKEKVTAKVIYTQHADLWSVFENKKRS